jgi:hypothetical protein
MPCKSATRKKVWIDSKEKITDNDSGTIDRGLFFFGLHQAQKYDAALGQLRCGWPPPSVTNHCGSTSDARLMAHSGAIPC